MSDGSSFPPKKERAALGAPVGRRPLPPAPPAARTQPHAPPSHNPPHCLYLTVKKPILARISSDIIRK